ncbi:MAG TPA: serine/threonine-protein kinase [Polyangiales bacterium]
MQNLKTNGGLTQGTRIAERYEITSALAAGGVGVVYAAWDGLEARDVAIKVLKRELSEHESLRPRFEREAHVVLSLGHPNIVLVTDHGVHDGCPYLVMERLQGRTLRARLDQGALPEHEAFDVMLQLLEGLSHAHSMGVAHRDLKPGNIFLHGDPSFVEQLKILDFGFAKLLAPDTELHGGGAFAHLTTGGVAFGTPAYMAPEQISLGSMDARTDVYSAGILLFELLSGVAPFSGELPQLLRQHLADDLPPIAKLRRGVQETPAFRALLVRATAKLPRERFADAGELGLALRNLPQPWLT